MRKILLLLTLLISFVFAQAQNVDGNDLRIYKNAQIGEDGNATINMHGNRVQGVADPINPPDAVNLSYFNANALSSGMVFDSIMWNTNITNLTVEKGKLYLDSIFQALRYSPDGINSIFLGRMLLNPLVINNTGSLIENLKVVYIDGEFSGKLSIQLADKSILAKSRMVGVTTEPILNGATGNVTRFGLIQGNTSALYVGAAAGDEVFLDNNGDITNLPATEGDFNVYIGFIKKLGITDGELYVNPLVEDFTAESVNQRGWSNSVLSTTFIVPTIATRTITISGTGYVYQDGIKYEFDNPSVIFDDIEGTFDVFFIDGVLTAFTNLTESQVREMYTKYPGVSRGYWDATNKTIVFINNMRHTFDMNGNTWSMAWDYHKCEVIDGGLGLVDMSVDGLGNIDADAQFGNASALIRNQDIITVVPAQVGTVGYTVFYREGALAGWRSQDGAPFPILNEPGGQAYWNEDVGGIWQLTEATNGSFLPYLFLASNTLGDKVGTIVPDAQYASAAAAETGGLAALSSLLNGLPIQEIKGVALVIYETKVNFNNAVKSRVVSTIEGFDYVDLRFDGSISGGAGGGSNSFIGNTDTPTTYAGAAGQAPVVNISETGLEFSEIVKTVNGETAISGNYDITMIQNKVGETITLNTSGTGNSVDINIADNDNSITNEVQDLINSKLNNTITITPSLGGVATTITEIPRIDFGNDFDLFNVFSGGASSSAGNTTRYGFQSAVGATGTNWTSVGTRAGTAVNAGNTWSAFGYEAGTSSTTSLWTAFGAFAGALNVTGDSWTAIGTTAGRYNTSGSNFVAVGVSAGTNLFGGGNATSYDNSVYVGNNTTVSANGVTNENVFGYEARGMGSNTVAIGDENVINNYFSEKITIQDFSASLSPQLTFRVIDNNWTIGSDRNNFNQFVISRASDFSNSVFETNGTTSTFNSDLAVNGDALIDDDIATLKLKSTALLALPTNEIRFLDANGVDAQLIQGGNGNDNGLRIINEKANIELYHAGSDPGDLRLSTTASGIDVNGSGSFGGALKATGLNYGDGAEFLDIGNVTSGDIGAGMQFVSSSSPTFKGLINVLYGDSFSIYKKTGSDYIKNFSISSSGTVEACYNGSKRFETTAVGTKTTGTVTATVDVNCVDLNYSGSLNPTSDKRVKDSIQPLQFDKETYLLLNPISSYYNYDSTKTIHGSFVAQDLEALYPNLVKHSNSKVVIDRQIVNITSLDSIAQLNIKDEDRLHTIDPMSIIPLNTLATQKALIKCDSLQGIIDENKLQIEVLKSLIKNLDDRLKTLEN